MSLATVLPTTRHKWTHPALTSARQPEAGSRFIYPGGMEGRVDLELTGYIPRWFTRPQTITHPGTVPAVHGRESNSRPVDHKSDATTPPSHPVHQWMQQTRSNSNYFTPTWLWWLWWWWWRWRSLMLSPKTSTTLGCVKTTIPVRSNGFWTGWWAWTISALHCLTDDSRSEPRSMDHKKFGPLLRLKIIIVDLSKSFVSKASTSACRTAADYLAHAALF